MKKTTASPLTPKSLGIDGNACTMDNAHEHGHQEKEERMREQHRGRKKKREMTNLFIYLNELCAEMSREPAKTVCCLVLIVHTHADHLPFILAVVTQFPRNMFCNRSGHTASSRFKRDRVKMGPRALLVLFSVAKHVGDQVFHLDERVVEWKTFSLAQETYAQG